MSDAEAAATLLNTARADTSKRLADLPEHLRPQTEADAYAIQHARAAHFDRIGGWKVGAPGPDAPPNCSPLPQSGITASPATLSARTRPLRAIESEVAFRIKTDLPPRSTPYTRDEVIAAIASAHPAIEVLESAFLDCDSVTPLTNLSDSLAHGGFIHGDGIANWHSTDFAHETVEQRIDEALLIRTGNPAGDMIRLVEWLANTGAVWAGGLKAGQFVTCGSWTGKTAAGSTAHVRVRFPSLGEVAVDYIA